jgi:hypothetical protein
MSATSDGPQVVAIGIASPQLTGMKDECASTTKNIVILFELLQGVKTIAIMTIECANTASQLCGVILSIALRNGVRLRL